MRELRLFFVREATSEWREIDARFLEMRRAGLVEGPVNRFETGRWGRLARQTELGQLWQHVQQDAVQFAALKRRFRE